MKRLIWGIVFAGAGGATGADFPADTLLPLTWVQTFVEPDIDYDSASFTYARDARDWLYETRVITEKSGYLSTTVTLTDREGKYRGGSFQKRTDPLITITAQHDSAGRHVRNLLEYRDEVYHEDFRYDAKGGLISKIMKTSDGLPVENAEQTFWANSYDADGRLVMSVESEVRLDSPTSYDKRVFDASGRLLYMLSGKGNPDSTARWDSTAYIYRPDGRLHEERNFNQDRSLNKTVRWEYRVWQVPVVGIRRRPPAAVRYPAGYPGSLHDALGRLMPGRSARPFAVFGGLP